MFIEDISIMIVEDENELKEYLKEYLQLFFKHIFLAKNGNDGYLRYLEKKPSIILTDINMPELDGLEMIAKIRARDQETKIIIMSAHSEKEKLLRAIELQLVTYLVKPIQTQDLKKVLLDTVREARLVSKYIYLSDSLYWNKLSKILYQGREEVPLNERELKILALLFSKPTHTFSAEEIFYHLYMDDSDKEFSSNAITSLIKRFRQKLPEDIISTEYGIGYKIRIK
jgi:DNA-binding response OmpR family regulator